MTVEVHNPNQAESKPLNTELETLAPETTAEQAYLSPDSLTTRQSSDDAGTSLGSVAASGGESSQAEPDYDAADFAAALANFDREQAAETAAAQNLTADEVVVTGTVVKITDKHVVVDIGLKSEGLIPLEQVLDLQGSPKFKIGDTVEVVVEREEAEGGYLVSHEKALRHKIWDTLEKAANDKVPVKGMVVSRVKGGLTVDIGIKAFLPGSQIEVRPVRNLDGYIGTEIEVRVIKLNKKRGNVVISRKEILEEDQNAKKSVTLSTLEEGSILTGTVKNLTDYGAFVDMGGLDGLLHITDMSWGRLTHPR
jgi:small subunit ribosomal protein S1